MTDQLETPSLSLLRVFLCRRPAGRRQKNTPNLRSRACSSCPVTRPPTRGRWGASFAGRVAGILLAADAAANVFGPRGTVADAVRAEGQGSAGGCPRSTSPLGVFGHARPFSTMPRKFHRR